MDPVDKSTLVSAINELLGNVSLGESYRYDTAPPSLTSATVPGLTLITPDNTTNIQDYVDNYDPSSLGSNHWVGSNRIATSASNGVVDVNTKVFGTDNLVSVAFLWHYDEY